MSYVIQNYQLHHKLSYQTPRNKLLLCYNNVNLIFFFYKTYFILVSLNREQIYLSNLRLKTISLLYHKYFLNKIQSLNFDFFGFYVNNLLKSLTFWNINLTYKFFANQLVFKTPLAKKTLYNSSNHNQYQLPVFISEIRLNDNKFKNSFFFNFFILAYAWYQHNNKINFKQNFLFPTHQLNVFQMFSGYFFKIYKY